MFVNKKFVNEGLITKITKILCYENLELYGKHFITFIRVHISGYIAYYNSCNKVYISSNKTQIHRDAYHHHMIPIYTI